MKTIQLKKGIYEHLIQTTKFKDVHVSFIYSMPLQKKDYTVAMVLSECLKDHCELYTTKKQMQEICDEYYGAKFEKGLRTMGATLMLNFRSTVINKKYGKDDCLYFQFDLMKNMLYRHGDFSQEAFEEAKRNTLLKEHLSQEQADSAIYDKMIESMEAPFCYALLKDSDQVTLEEAKALYRRMLQSQLDIFVCGDVAESEVSEALKLFSFTDVDEICLPFEGAAKFVLHEGEEQKDYQQSSLVLSYSTDILASSSKAAAAKVANAILGSLPTSALFQEIREKRSLCYWIFSQYSSFSGLFTVMTQIEASHKVQVIELIEQQIQQLAQGQFSDELLETSKKMLVNNCYLEEDNRSSLVHNRYLEFHCPAVASMDELRTQIAKVTREQVMQVMNGLKRQFIYFMKERVHEED